MQFLQQYHQLGGAFYQQTMPVPVKAPKLLLWNESLAGELNIAFNPQTDKALLAEIFSGNKVVEGAIPLAQAYSGHQFGHFNPQLGDGRAHLLGELNDIDGHVRDVQLKGSGVTRYSRRGDGRCALGPALREFIMSEAMFALDVPTTRCLAVVATGEQVYRERPYAGAVVTRVASSHIRVGTFQYFAMRKDVDSLRKLTDFAIERHFPDIKNEAEAELTQEQVLAFFSAVSEKQIPLILSWMRVGFIHGVMNTDNTAISGETIDFGPCAMMNNYHRETVFSSIDKYGRYAFGEQMTIMMWNMTRFAETLLPLVSDDEEQAVALLQPLLSSLHQKLMQGYLVMMAAKLGIEQLAEHDAELVTELIEILESQGLDYTQTFVKLTRALVDEELHHELKASLGEWFERWLKRVSSDKESAQQIMQKHNPLVIPRNHHVEAVLKESQETGDLSALQQFLAVLQQPYSQLQNTHLYQDAPLDNDENYHTFCGT